VSTWYLAAPNLPPLARLPVFLRKTTKTATFHRFRLTGVIFYLAAPNLPPLVKWPVFLRKTTKTATFHRFRLPGVNPVPGTSQPAATGKMASFLKKND
jgi:hypothetical protein